MADESKLGITDFNSVSNETQNTAVDANQQANNDATLRSNDPEVRNQVQTANQNRNPEVVKPTENVASETGTEASSNFNRYATHFNYRGTTDANMYEPNKVIPNQHDLSVNSIIGYLKGTAMELKPIDVAYLKKLGVYANNRLIIARRFPGPVQDDLYYQSSDQKRTFPLSTVVSWVDPEDEFLKFTFNEVWEEHTDTIQKIFQDILENDFKLNLGDSIPLPGWSTGLQFAFLEALGVTNAGADNVPEGNPNLIMETSRRKVPGDAGGSGLQSNFQINMRVEYEIKYIPGIDPSIAFHDIMANLITMGTSESQFYLTGGAGDTITRIVEMIQNGQYTELIQLVIEKMVEAINGVIEKVGDLANQRPDSGNNEDDWGWEDGGGGGKSANEEAGLITSSLNSILNIAGGLLDIIAKGIISKYREKIKASVAAMTGSPNAPWHVTIGNPRKPMFTSGDMICKEVEIELGKELGFNDLPTELIANIKFECARPLGAQEIMRKFNAGKGRIYGKADKDYFTKSENLKSEQNAKNSQTSANKSAQSGGLAGGLGAAASSADVF